MKKTIIFAAVFLLLTGCKSSIDASDSDKIPSSSTTAASVLETSSAGETSEIMEQTDPEKPHAHTDALTSQHENMPTVTEKPVYPVTPDTTTSTVKPTPSRKPIPEAGELPAVTEFPVTEPQTKPEKETSPEPDVPATSNSGDSGKIELPFIPVN